MFFFESSDGVLDSSTLYFSRTSKVHFGDTSSLLGSIEFLRGVKKDGINELVYESTCLEIDTFGGYISDEIEDIPNFSFTTSFTADNQDEVNTHVVVSKDSNLSVHITFLRGYLDEDIAEVENYFMQGEIKNHGGRFSFGDIVPISLDDEAIESRIGSRFILKVV